MGIIIIYFILFMGLMLLHQLLNNKIECSEIVNRVGFRVQCRLPRYPCALLNVRRSLTNLGAHALMPRVSRLYNKFASRLPLSDVFHDSESALKKKILSVDVFSRLFFI